MGTGYGLEPHTVLYARCARPTPGNYPGSHAYSRPGGGLLHALTPGAETAEARQAYHDSDPPWSVSGHVARM